MNSDNSRRDTESETAMHEDSGHNSCSKCGREGDAEIRTLVCGNTFCQRCFDTLDKLTDGPREVLCGCDDCNTYRPALENDDTGGPPPSENDDDTGGPPPSENDDTGGPPPSPTPTDVSARVSFPVQPTSTTPKPKKRSKNCEIYYAPGGSWPR